MGAMFQKKIAKLYNWMPNVFSTTDYILIAGFDELGREHHTPSEKVPRICRQATLKLNKDKCLYRCTRIPFIGEEIS